VITRKGRASERQIGSTGTARRNAARRAKRNPKIEEMRVAEAVSKRVQRFLLINTEKKPAIIHPVWTTHATRTSYPSSSC
jgi:hypothetical protein